MKTISKKTATKIAIALLVSMGAITPYLGRPTLDTIVLTLLPISLSAVMIAIIGLPYAMWRKQKIPRFFFHCFNVAVFCGSPFLGWLIGDAIFQTSSHWSAYVYSSRDNGISHKRLGFYSNVDDCQKQARDALTQPTSLNIKDCAGEACLADSYICGLNCGIDSSEKEVFISELICTKQVGEQLKDYP